MDYLWATKQGFDDQAWIADLPYTLRVEVSSFQKYHLVENCPLFTDLDSSLIKRIAYALRYHSFSPGDMVVRSGDLGLSMYFIQSGFANIVSGDLSSLLSTVVPGASFGEYSMFTSTRRTFAVISVGYAEMLELRKVDIESILAKFENELSDIYAAAQRLEKQSEQEKAKNKARLSGCNFLDSSDVLIKSDFLLTYHKRSKIIQPLGTFRIVWDTVALVLLAYLVMVTPVRIAYEDIPASAGFWTTFMIDYAAEVFFICDMYYRSMRFAFVSEGKVVNDPDRVWERYKHRMFSDIIAVVPFELISLSSGSTILWSFIRIKSLMRLIHIGDHIETVGRYMHKMRMQISQGLKQIITGFILLICINHWFGCMWFMLHRYVYLDSGKTWAIKDNLATYNATLGRHNIMNADVTASECYIRGVYFVITVMSTVGYGDIRPYQNGEVVFGLFVILTGACLFAGIIGSLAGWFKYSDSSGNNAFKERTKLLNEYLRYRSVPLDLCHSINLHYQCMWDRTGCLDEIEVTSVLPQSLQLEVARIVNRDIISKVPMLRKCDEWVQKRLALALQPQFCASGDYLYKIGDLGTELFFIRAGQVMITIKGKKGSVVLSTGDHFGEATLTSKSGARSHSAQAATMCELYILTKRHFEEILSCVSPEDRDEFFQDLYATHTESSFKMVKSPKGGDRSLQPKQLKPKLERKPSIKRRHSVDGRMELSVEDDAAALAYFCEKERQIVVVENGNIVDEKVDDSKEDENSDDEQVAMDSQTGGDLESKSDTDV
jgi:CRP-like cAMP-binding protein